MKEKTYVAVIKNNAVRDVQYCTNTKHDLLNDDAWLDYEDAEIYLGIFNGDGALEQAAKYALTDPANINPKVVQP